jgi:hypothetical protein
VVYIYILISARINPLRIVLSAQIPFRCHPIPVDGPSSRARQNANAVTRHDRSQFVQSPMSTEPSRNMPSNLPVDALPMILKNLDKADLIAMCRVNKVCCSFSQDIIYRNFFDYHKNPPLIWRTLAHSTHLARRARSFFVSPPDWTMESNQVDNLATALRNMSSKIQ